VPSFLYSRLPALNHGKVESCAYQRPLRASVCQSGGRDRQQKKEMLLISFAELRATRQMLPRRGGIPGDVGKRPYRAPSSKHRYALRNALAKIGD